MAIVAMWQCDRDGSMFASKKDAEAYDKMLELAESFSSFITAAGLNVSEDDAEAIGLALSKHKDAVMAACRGKAEALTEIEHESPAEPDSGKSGKKRGVVTPIAAKS